MVQLVDKNPDFLPMQPDEGCEDCPGLEIVKENETWTSTHKVARNRIHFTAIVLWLLS